MRGLELPERAEDFTADPVELFFDLTFVFAFSQIVAVMLREPNWHGIGRAALILLLIWLPWSQFTWSANAVSGGSRRVRILFLIASVASIPMAAAIGSAFDGDGELFALPLAVIFVAALVLMVIGLENGTDEYRSSLRYAAPSVIAVVIVVVGGFLDGSAQILTWLVGVAVWFVATALSGRGSWIIRSGHFAERHGLIVIIALGEVIVALGTAVVVQLRDLDSGFTATDIVSLVAAGIFAGLLWWSYFDRVGPALEHRGESLPDHERGRYARDVYTYAHLVIVAGIILSAVTLEDVALDPVGPVPAVIRAMGGIGFALFYAGASLAVFRAFRAVAFERLAAIAAVGVFLVFSGDLHGVWLVLAIDVIIFASLAVEHLRIEKPYAPASANAGSVDDGGVGHHAAL